MSRTTTMTVRLGGALSDFVAANVGDDGSYENVSEYIRDLIRRDQERKEKLRALQAAITQGIKSGVAVNYDIAQIQRELDAEWDRSG